ncbi:MAG: hypothetical protein NXI24_10965 [bacterium]|nr:hypothetical protein [bacterium]
MIPIFRHRLRSSAGALAAWPTLILATALLWPSGPVSAQEDPLAVRLNWEARPGANEYWLQIRDEDRETVIDKRVAGESLTFRLQPGDYSQRISAVNRLGTAGTWSPWQPLRIRITRVPLIGAIKPVGEEAADGSRTVEVRGRYFTDHTKVFLERPGKAPQEVPVTLRESSRLLVLLRPADIGDGRYSLVVQNPRGLKKTKDDTVAVLDRRIEIPEAAQQPVPEVAEADEDENDRGPVQSGDWRTLVPGLPAYTRGEGGGAWVGAIGGMFLLMATEYEAGVNARETFERRPYARYFNDIGLFGFVTASANPSIEQIGLFSLAYLRDQREAERAYSRHRNRQVYLGSAIVLTWGAHFIYENRDRWRMSHLVPGLTQSNRGEGGRAGFWMGTLGTLGVAALSEYRAAEVAFRGVDRNVTGKLIAEPAVAIVGSQFLGISTDLAFLGYNRARSGIARKIRRARGRQRNASYLTAAFAALYFGQIIDATLSGDRPADNPAPDAGGIESENRSGGAFASPSLQRSYSLNPEDEVHHMSFQIYFE